MKAVTVRPEFSGLKAFTSSLPQTFDQLGRVIYNGRNVIRKVDTGDRALVVKNFKGMYFLNRLAYSLFRPSKAARSYLYSDILNAKGIRTPPHVSWIDCYSMGLLTRSYFVSEYAPYETLEQTIQYYNIYDPSRKHRLFRDVAAFAHRLHKLGIYHEDFSLGNILVIPKPDQYDFALLDLNRIKFETVSFEKGLRNFITLRASAEDLEALIGEYAAQASKSRESAVEQFWQYERRKMYLRRLRRKFRRYTLSPIEKIFHKRHS